MNPCAKLLLAVLSLPCAAAATEADATSDPMASERFTRALEQARAKAAASPLAVGAATAETSAASLITATSARLNGTVTPAEALSADAYFDYGPTAAFGSKTIKQQVSGSAAQAISSDVPGLSCDTQYFFRVHAEVKLADQREALGAPLTFTTSACALAPTVTTSAASPIGTGSATLNGSVNPNGAPSTAAFDYGTTQSFGQTASAGSINAGNAAVQITASITQLACGTQYFFRARASNGTGSTDGTTLSFNTTACPVSAPEVTTLAATLVGTTTATLNANVDANGVTTTTRFDFGTSPDALTREAIVGGSLSGTSPVQVSAEVGQLNCGTQYYFRASASNSSGTVAGSTLSFATTACPDLPPTVTTLDASAIAPTSATFNGTVDPNGVSTSARFQYGTSAGSLNLNAIIGDIGSGDSVPISTSVSGLVCNTTYFFRARATSTGGTVNGQTLSFTTSACAALPPTVTTTAATVISSNGATLNGTVNPKGLATSASFQYGLAANALNQAAVATSPGSGNTAVAVQAAVTELQCNTQYFFRAAASNAGGSGNGNTLTFTTSACPAPPPVAVTLAASGIGPVGAILNGTVDPNGSLTTVYFDLDTTPSLGPRIAYAKIVGGDPIPVALPTGKLQCDTTYYFRVRAVNAGGGSTGSTLSFTTGSCGGVCKIDFGLSCGGGDTWSTNNPGTTDVVEDYISGTFQRTNMTGPEYTYIFASDTTVEATLVLSGLFADLDLFVLDQSRGSCTGTNCIVGASVGGTFGESLTFTAVAGVPYYVVVDGPAGASSDYTLEANCTQPAVPPDVTVGAATRVTLGEATIQGTANPHDASTTLYIDYGLALFQYDRSVVVGSALNGAFDIAIGFELAGLVCGNTYYYRLRAESAAGTSVSAQATFTTAPCGAAVCKADFPLNCGTGDSWGNAQFGNTDNLDSYTCFGEAYNGYWPGPEYTYFFTPTQTVYATITMFNMTADLDLLVLTTPGGVCTGGNCIQIASTPQPQTPTEQVSFVANQGQTYDVNVDGWQGAIGTYSIEASCIVIPIFSSSYE